VIRVAPTQSDPVPQAGTEATRPSVHLRERA
jgi:hypothetical protein